MKLKKRGLANVLTDVWSGFWQLPPAVASCSCTRCAACRRNRATWGAGYRRRSGPPTRTAAQILLPTSYDAICLKKPGFKCNTMAPRRGGQGWPGAGGGGRGEEVVEAGFQQKFNCPRAKPNICQAQPRQALPRILRWAASLPASPRRAGPRCARAPRRRGAI
jgi:hypothetical protein